MPLLVFQAAERKLRISCVSCEYSCYLTLTNCYDALQLEYDQARAAKCSVQQTDRQTDGCAQAQFCRCLHLAPEFQALCCA